MSAYVLVHGGVHAAWCWETVVGPLTDAGHHVQAIDLPGRAATASAAVLAERAGAAFQMIDSDHSPFYSARADLIRILLDHG
jgi:alpha-beta hydrolase superfamily lysophospholipase